MDLVRLVYTGRKTYHDTASGTSWQPGAQQMVPDHAARRLLGFVEFERAQPAPQAQAQQEEQAALMLAQQAQQAKRQESETLEGMLLAVQGMGKQALVDYAAKYEVKLDKRQNLGELRQQVATLVEQYGVR